MAKALPSQSFVAEAPSAQDQEFADNMDVNGTALIDLSHDPDILALCDQARVDMDAFGYTHGSRIQDLWQRSLAVRSLATLPQLIAPLETYYGRRAIPFQTLNFKFGSQQAAHSDLMHFTPDPIEFMCGVWLALEDVHEEAGPLEYFPGSHKWPVVTLHDVGAPPNQSPETSYKTLYEPAMAAQIARNKISARHGLIKKGQAIVWVANLVHGGAPRSDELKTRYSQVTHFFFEDCTYHTLMYQRGNKRRIRLPHDIRTGQFAQPVLRPGDHLTLSTRLRAIYKRLNRVTLGS
ncbi:phytanoyl-CoA dioxygenase family protein [Candidatus Phycosocius spiralis]|uniref:Phytanoyl-CoA dioxygenase n=1 Tax=Candidatus Phycosocius spiralis TaxID=2815099 RepID=A0ABQ4PW89_9PROT|nr:phytanoyl-CoA dioxygenase family protein [Candidatus Phycosocius spiralis]GIU67201.1 hypothetical protein PsB1_1355 [Candidatus Phycosocius spiralis]